MKKFKYGSEDLITALIFMLCSLGVSANVVLLIFHNYDHHEARQLVGAREVVWKWTQIAAHFCLLCLMTGLGVRRS